jgi:zinc transport system substrate-binding protein
MHIVHTDTDIAKRLMRTHHHNEEAKNSAEKALHFRDETKSHHPNKRGNSPPVKAIKDPHIWTSPPLVKIQARNILHGLLTEDPAHQALYQANFNKFISQLDELDAELRKTFAGSKRLEFMVFHPAWGYFADTYGLRQVPIEIEGKSPKPAQLKRLIIYAQKRGIKVVFVQPQFSTKNAETIARAIGGEVVFADPLAYNWAENLRRQAAAFKAELK